MAKLQLRGSKKKQVDKQEQPQEKKAMNSFKMKQQNIVPSKLNKPRIPIVEEVQEDKQGKSKSFSMKRVKESKNLTEKPKNLSDKLGAKRTPNVPTRKTKNTGEQSENKSILSNSNKQIEHKEPNKRYDAQNTTYVNEEENQVTPQRRTQAKITQQQPQQSQQPKVKKVKESLTGYQKVSELLIKNLTTKDIVTVNTHAYSTNALSKKGYPTIEEHVTMGEGLSMELSTRKESISGINESDKKEEQLIEILPELAFGDFMGDSNNTQKEAAGIFTGELELELEDVREEETTELKLEESPFELEESNSEKQQIEILEDNENLGEPALEEIESTDNSETGDSINQELNFNNEELIELEEPLEETIGFEEETIGLEEETIIDDNEDNDEDLNTTELNLEDTDDGSSLGDLSLDTVMGLTLPVNDVTQETLGEITPTIKLTLPSFDEIDETNNEELIEPIQLNLNIKPLSIQNSLTEEPIAITKKTINLFDGNTEDVGKKEYGKKKEEQEESHGELYLGQTYNIEDLKQDNTDKENIKATFLTINPTTDIEEENGIDFDKYGRSKELLNNSKSLSEALKHLEEGTK